MALILAVYVPQNVNGVILLIVVKFINVEYKFIINVFFHFINQFQIVNVCEVVVALIEIIIHIIMIKTFILV
jgi:hypothetical protein